MMEEGASAWGSDLVWLAPLPVLMWLLRARPRTRPRPSAGRPQISPMCCERRSAACRSFWKKSARFVEGSLLGSLEGRGLVDRSLPPSTTSMNVPRQTMWP